MERRCSSCRRPFNEGWHPTWLDLFSGVAAILSQGSRCACSRNQAEITEISTENCQIGVHEQAAGRPHARVPYSWWCQCCCYNSENCESRHCFQDQMVRQDYEERLERQERLAFLVFPVHQLFLDHVLILVQLDQQALYHNRDHRHPEICQARLDLWEQQVNIIGYYKYHYCLPFFCLSCLSVRPSVHKHDLCKNALFDFSVNWGVFS